MSGRSRKSRKRRSRSRSSSRNRSRNHSRSRSRSSRANRRYHKSNKNRQRNNDREKDRRGHVYDAILGRLEAIEGQLCTSLPDIPPHPPRVNNLLSNTSVISVENNISDNVSGQDHHEKAATQSVDKSNSDDVANKIANALSSLVQSKSNFYISSFDPSVHNFDDWCTEVEQGRKLNNWDDNECLSRVGNCLRGEARVWINNWVTSDRTWSNFKSEFKSLCPQKVDIANILFEVMCTNFKNFTTYSEYARRSLLRLNIVKGLSNDLKSAIVIRGITDPQVKAAATNAKLQPNDIVEFLSVYTKPKTDGTISFNKIPRLLNNSSNHNSNPRRIPNPEIKCYSCNGIGHKRHNCPKKRKFDSIGTVPNVKLVCSFCKKPGHSVEKCFIKQRSENDNKQLSNVNFCNEIKNLQKNNVIAAVIQKIPVDTLIDSGSDISLISDSVVNFLNLNKVPTYRLLRGIGSQEIECTLYVTTVVEFPEISLEVDLYVVPSECISAPVLIGTDVLDREGVTYVRTNNAQYITRVNNTLRVNNVHVVDTNSINTPLCGDDKKRLISIVNKYSNSFVTGTATTTVNTGSMEIKLVSDVPVHYRPYKLSADEKTRVRDIINDLLSKGIIRESQSDYASPVILVKKKDGSDRMCVDYRALNAITVKERYPLPLIDDHIDRLGSHKYFTSLDMATGFHQIPIKDDQSIRKTAFVTPEGHFEYLRMPYGLSNAPVVYQRIISKTLGTLLETGKVLNYIDDVLILSDSISEGLDLLDRVLKILVGAGFSINIKKCTFLDVQVEYLGRLISQGQVRPSPKKVEALIKSPKPVNVKQVRQFLGLAGYFRRYIANYAVKTSCIARLTKKDVPFVWGEDQNTARNYIIDCLTNEPVLAVFDPKLNTELHTDASSSGYGAILLQQHESKGKRVVAYFSRATQGAESRYHSYELETLAIVKALQHFRHYLLGIKFKIVTDCNSLKLTERKKDLLPRVARWWVYLQDFRFTIEYRKGIMMQHADFFSRNPINVSHIRRPNNWAQIAQTADSETLDLIDKLKEGQLDSSRYVIRNHLLYYKYSPTGEDSRLLCFIPKGHRLSLLRVFHDDHDHIGVDKTTDLILRHFWFPGIRQFVKKYIIHCVVCLSHKKVPKAPNQPIESWSKPNVPFSVIHVDILGPLAISNGFKYILIMVDAFSKYCLLYSLYRQDTEELKRVFSNAISLFGTPSLIITDRGRMFESAGYRDWISGLGCNIHMITPQMHQENGQVERYCRTVLNMLRVEVNSKGTEWSDSLWKIQLTLNITKHATTRTSALQLLVGIEATTPVIRALVRDVSLENSQPNREAMLVLRRQRASDLLEANRCRQDNYANKGRKQPRMYAEGDFVFVNKSSQSLGKLDSGMRGPYRIVRQLPHNRYELELLAGSYGKRSQAAAEHMVQWHGEWTPETCEAFFVGDNDGNNDDVLAVEDAPQSGEAVL